MQPEQRPKYLNLIQIRLPIPGMVSIAHRISGVLMFLAIPMMTYALHTAVRDEAGFLEIGAIMDNIVIKLMLLILTWSLLHHLLAGIRYLLIDMDIGVDKPSARTSAAMVMAIAVIAALITGAILL